MKKTIAAVAAGILLVAGQASATSQELRIGDRVGARAGDSSEFAGVPAFGVAIGVLAAVGVLAAAIAVASDDSSESD